MGSIFRVNLIRPYHVQCTLLRQRNIIFPANMMTSYLPDFDNDHSNFVYKKSGLIYLYLVLSAQACQSSFREFIIFYRIKKSTETCKISFCKQFLGQTTFSVEQKGFSAQMIDQDQGPLIRRLKSLFCQKIFISKVFAGIHQRGRLKGLVSLNKTQLH